MKSTADINLLRRYIRLECTRAETEQVKAFLLQPEWQAALAALLEEDFQSFIPEAPQAQDSAEWYQRFHQRHVVPARPVRRMVWLRYAAIVTLFIGLPFYLFQHFKNTGTSTALAMQEKYNARGQRSKITLTDSSVVYLGPESRLQFPEQFGAGNREIYLTGEAFFEVAKNKDHPFIIHTGVLQTEVLGTSFKVDAFSGKPLVVAVVTGKVQVTRNAAGQTMPSSLALLTAGQEVHWDALTAKRTVNNTDTANIADWRRGKLHFVATSLADIAEELERTYNVKISFSSTPIKSYHVSLVVNTLQPVTQALEIICNTTHLSFTRSGNTFIISKTGGA